jgi:hypothetical protein
MARVQEPKLFGSVEYARGFVRKVIGTNGDYDRKHNNDKSLFREKRKPGQWNALLPKSAIKRKDPLKKFSEKIAVQKTIVGKEIRENSPIRGSPMRGNTSPGRHGSPNKR